MGTDKEEGGPHPLRFFVFVSAFMVALPTRLWLLSRYGEFPNPGIASDITLRGTLVYLPYAHPMPGLSSVL